MNIIEPVIAQTLRQRLPNRRPYHTEALEIAGHAFTATVGFDPESDQPLEWLPADPVAPVDLDHVPGQMVPASPIGAALDLITAFQKEAVE